MWLYLCIACDLKMTEHGSLSFVGRQDRLASYCNKNWDYSKAEVKVEHCPNIFLILMSSILSLSTFITDSIVAAPLHCKFCPLAGYFEAENLHIDIHFLWEIAMIRFIQIIPCVNKATFAAIYYSIARNMRLLAYFKTLLIQH